MAKIRLISNRKPTHEEPSNVDMYHIKQLTYKVEMLIKKVEKLLYR